jgi:integrase/recombinase XerC
MKPPSADLHSQVQAYLHELHVLRQLSPHTIKAYQADLSELHESAQEDGLDLIAVTNSHIRRWAARLHSKGKSPRTIARTLSAWRGLYDWLSQKQDQPTLKANPVDDVKAPKRSRALPKALSVEQALALINQAILEAKANPGLETVRDAAIIELLYSSGLRLSELLGIDVAPSQDRAYESAGWLDWDSAEVTVLGKGGKRRSVPVGKAAMSSLRAWLEMRQQLQFAQATPALFLGSRDARLSTHVHPHMMRHSFASHVLQSSHDLRAVQEMLGHASIASTQIYTALDFQHLAQAYDLAHPRAKAGRTK